MSPIGKSKPLEDDICFERISQLAYEEEGLFICCECNDDFTGDVDENSSFERLSMFYECEINCKGCNGKTSYFKTDDGKFVCCECGEEYKGDGELKLLLRIICKDCYESECIYYESGKYYEWIK